MKRIGLARNINDALCLTAISADWDPVPFFVTKAESIPVVRPIKNFDAAIILSPTAARFAQIPHNLLCIVQGEATARPLRKHKLLVSSTPRAEGLFDLLKQCFPNGGKFILFRAEKSRKYLEMVTNGTNWQIDVCVTHREIPINHLSPITNLDAVLALSPLQAEILGPLSQGLLRFAWGRRTNLAFDKVGYPATGWCEPEAFSLRRLLMLQTTHLGVLC